MNINPVSSQQNAVISQVREAEPAETVLPVSGLLGLGLLSAAFLALFISQLRGEWEANPNYAFGWGVPFLGIILFARRWRDRPQTQNDVSRTSLWVLGGVLALWLPIRILREANADWRLLEWMIFAIAGGSIFGLLRQAGGRTFARHFIAPILFLGLAVPWPTQIETQIVQGLSFAVVKTVVEALRWAGVAAWSTGSLIHLPGSTIGVEEACSGVRALQGAAMCAFFIGELRRLKMVPRVALFGIGIAAAVLVNFVRTFWLALVAARNGEAAVAGWHDGAGLAALTIVFATLWAAARLMSGKRQPRGAEVEASTERTRLRVFHPAIVTGCIAWLVLCELATGMWYSRHSERRLSEVRLAREAVPDLRDVPISEQIRSILRCDEASAYRRNLADGTEWWIHNISWNANGAGANLTRYHSPEICFPAAGFKAVGTGRLLTVNGLPFRFIQYEWSGKPVYVFTSYRANGAGVEAIRRFEDFDLTWEKRLKAAFRGERVGQQQVVQVSISGATSEGAAVQAFRELAGSALVPVTEG